ncbi:MAG: fatty acid desaturase [Candidatus Promineifilaceae bacterium]|jgi:acyl-lipid omega-6 desaturase (Delta-12 desaturase)
MSADAMLTKGKVKTTTWKTMVKPYQASENSRAAWQVINSFVPMFVLSVLMYLSMDVSYLLTLLIALPTAGMLVRIFIIQHDCGHGSFFTSRKANDRVGTVCGVFTLTPYFQWRKSHAIHHATAGNLTKRDVHDVFTMTVKEYSEASTAKKLRYRLYRNPVTLFLIVPMVLFVVLYRFPAWKSRRKEWMGVLLNDLMLLIMVVTASYYIGFGTFLMLYLPVVFVATFIGSWLFYVQHQFEDTYWAEGDEWDYAAAALEGSSYYKLPKILQWFTGNIGFHHIHHLSPRIPNYKLQSCHENNPDLQNIPTMTLASSIKSSTLTLWDEEEKRLISFREFRRRSGSW